MSFDLFMRQVSAISSVSGQMTGHVAATRGKLGAGFGSQQTLGASLLLSDALRLLVLLDDMREAAFEELEQLQVLEVHNANSLLFMNEDIAQVSVDRDLLAEMVTGLNEALDVVKYEIAQVATLAQDVTHLARSAGQEGIYDQAKEMLNNELLPELYRMRDDIEVLLERAVAALRAKEAHVWFVETVFKFVLPLNLKLKLRRKVARADEDGTLREGLPAADLTRLRALVDRALKVRGAVHDPELRARLQRFLDVTAPEDDQKV